MPYRRKKTFSFTDSPLVWKHVHVSAWPQDCEYWELEAGPLKYRVQFVQPSKGSAQYWRASRITGAPSHEAPVLLADDHGSTRIPKRAAAMLRAQKDLKTNYLLVYLSITAAKPLSRKNPTTRRDFSPSYDTFSQEEYDERVAECAPYTHLPWDQRPAGCKRLLHDMLPGGRQTQRAVSASHPLRKYGRKARSSRKLSEYTDPVPPLIPSTHTRWAGPEPPFGARTQSAKTRGNAKGKRAKRTDEVVLAQQIAGAIARYRQGQAQAALGVLVPNLPHPLVAAGMPAKAASILAARAKGQWYSAVAVPTAPPSIEQQIVGGLGAPLQIHGFEISINTPDGPAVLQELSLVSTDDDLGLFSDLIDAEEVKEAHERWKRGGGWRTGLEEEAPRSYHAPTDDPRFLSGIMRGVEGRIRDTRAEWGSVPVDIEAIFSRGGKTFERKFSLREHSKSGAPGASAFSVEYRTLENVSLSELPYLLARLSLRKKRKGRTSKPFQAPRARKAKKNPSMADDNQLAEMLKASGGSIPVPGKPGRVYYYSNRRKAVVETSAARAKSWIAIGEAGKAARSALKREALQAYAEEGMGREPRLLREPVAPRLETAPLPRAKVPPMTRRARRDLVNPALENPHMPHYADDEDFWFEQYSQGPYGGQQAIPSARRNAGKRRKKQKVKSPKLKAWRAEFGQIASRAHAIRAAKGCSLKAAFAQAKAETYRAPARANGSALQNRKRRSKKKSAKQTAWQYEFGAISSQARQIMRATGCGWKQAWDQARLEIGRTPQRAAANPWVDHGNRWVPDTTQTRSALVPHAPWNDETEVFSALVPQRYTQKAKSNGQAAEAMRLKSELGISLKEAWAIVKGKRNPGRRGQGKAYGLAKKAGWSIDKGPETSMWPHHPVYEQVRGQFGVSEAWTHGLQPANRRNPSHGGSKIGRWPKDCPVCGQETKGTEIADSGHRGPKGGKVWAHTACI